MAEYDSGHNIGFLTLRTTVGSDGYIGAILVTNAMGIPQEFRCTRPVKPTPVQRTLYGYSLIPYIGVELCGKPLVKAIQTRCQVIVVEYDYLTAVQSNADCPMVYVRRAGEAIQVQGEETSTATRLSGRLDSNRFQPIVMALEPGADYNFTEAQKLIENIFVNVDLLEPFDRITAALESLAQQSPDFR
jgi:hypothetical protein